VVNERVVENTINSLKMPGINDKSTKVVKLLSKEISPIMTLLIKMMFMSETYPMCIKTAVVIPINKSGDKTSLSDYRIIEKIIHKE
jgi:hypothetical protein